MKTQENSSVEQWANEMEKLAQDIADSMPNCNYIDLETTICESTGMPKTRFRISYDSVLKGKS